MRGDDQIPAKRNSLAPFETYEVEKGQFKHIESSATSIAVPLSAMWALLPVAITLHVTLDLATISDVRTEARLWAVTTAFYLVGILCGIFAFIQRGQLKRYMQEIRDNQVPPVAAKGAATPTDLTSVSDPDARATTDNTPLEQSEERNDAR